jgi:LysM repeat protein
MRRRVLPAAALLAVLPLSVDLLHGTAAAAEPARPATRPATGANGASSGTTNYTVQPGDFLIGIADKLGIRLDDLLRLNGLTATSVVHPGRVLKVPARLTTYTVKANDTMSGIASRHGMTMADLLATNGLKASSVLFPGMTLKVAAKVSSPTPAPSTTVKPTAPTTTAPKVGSSNKVSTYTVASGDFLIGIANKLGIRLVDLLALNGLTLTSAVHPGTTLQVPAGAKSPTTPTTTAPPATSPPTTPGAPKPGGTYTVVAGDFLLGIARKLNVRFSDLLAVNQLGADSVVHPGTVLAVPATKLPPTTPTTSVPTPPTTAPSGAVPYIVRSGDSVLGISYRFGLKYGPILRLNGITLDTPLQPGATLLLPPGTVIPPTPTTTTPPTTSCPCRATTRSTGWWRSPEHRRASPTSSSPPARTPTTARG